MLELVPDSIKAAETKKECEDFFQSDWYQELRDFAPDVIPQNMMEVLTK